MLTVFPLHTSTIKVLLPPIESTQDATVFVVGGAAVALVYDAGRSTRALDAAFDSSYEDAGAYLRMTSQVGVPNGQDEDWLNDGAKGMMPGYDKDAQVIYDGQALDVYVASPQYLLAMKLYAARPGRDLNDAVKLWSISGYTSESQGVALLRGEVPTTFAATQALAFYSKGR